MANNSMPPLLRIPVELRHHIYRYIFRTPSGYIQLVRSLDDLGILTTRFEPYISKQTQTPIITIGPAITAPLRTCKQMLQEGKDIFWEENGLSILPDPNILALCVPRPGEKFLRHIRHVLLDNSIGNHWNSLEQANHVFHTLKWCAEAGQLRSVTLLCIPHDALSRMVFEMSNGNTLVYLELFAWCYELEYERMLQVLRDAGGPKGTIAKLERKVVFKDVVRQKFQDLLTKETRQGLLKIIKDVNDAFGGELWVNGALCMKDGQWKHQDIVCKNPNIEGTMSPAL